MRKNIIFKFYLPELTNDADQNVPQHELERVTAAEKNIQIKNKLDMLTRELDSVKDQNAVTDYDVLHMEVRILKKLVLMDGFREFSIQNLQ